MDHLDDISVGKLQEALDNVEGQKPTERLLAAIAYKNGVTQTELAGWHGVQRRTIYNWLDRLDTDGPLERAVFDDKRTGRTRKITEEEQKEFEEAVHDPPAEVGLDAPTWTPALVQQYLEGTYGVEYSIPSCRRLLKEAGLRYRERPHMADEDDEGGRERCGGSDGRWLPQ